MGHTLIVAKWDQNLMHDREQKQLHERGPGAERDRGGHEKSGAEAESGPLQEETTGRPLGGHWRGRGELARVRVTYCITASNVLTGRKHPCRTWELNPCQCCAWPFGPTLFGHPHTEKPAIQTQDSWLSHFQVCCSNLSSFEAKLKTFVFSQYLRPN